uniref:Uncharacterized protein n=1 Tax=Arion vulgaris TaxID=1028688 RepID=A0A0B7ANN3_9EUPU
MIYRALFYDTYIPNQFVDGFCNNDYVCISNIKCQHTKKNKHIQQKPDTFGI